MSILNKTTLLSLLFTFVSSYSFGQLNGNVVDQNEAPLAFVNVLVLNAIDSSLLKGDLTQDDGSYTFDNIEQGKYLIQVNMVGYNTVYSDMIVYDDQGYQVPLTILSEGIAMDEVVVTAQKPLIELKADKVVVNVENSIVSAGNSALEVLQKSPGIVVDNNDRISLRGREGALVMINGKKQYMSAEDITRMLRNMPANNIKLIEIITNPSAKYDAEGNVGIINIIMKKNENLGYNGQFGITDRLGQRNSFFTNLNLNYRTEKINIYGGGDYYDWGNANTLNLNRNIPSAQGFTAFDQNSDIESGGDGFNAKLGLDWQITPKTTLGVLAKVNDGNEFSNLENNTLISGANGPNYDRLFVDTDGLEFYNQSSANLNLRHEFNDQGMVLTFDTDFSTYTNDGEMNYLNNYFNNDGSMAQANYLLRNNTNRAIDIFASQVDFVLPLDDQSKIEIGSKYSNVSTQNGTFFKYQGEDKQWVDLNDRSNTFMYTEEVMAGYVNVSNKLGPIMVQGGLRIEHTESEGFSVTLDQRVPRNYTDFFPSVSMSHMIGKKHSLSYAYSRRLNRPNYKSLNPFEFYLDEYTFERGNPFLNPQYSNNFSVNYSLGNALFVSLNYSHTKDAITEVIEQDASTNRTFQTELNLDDFRNYSINVTVPKVWNEWWVTRLNYNGFYNQYNSDFSEGTIDRGQYSNVIYLGNEFNLNNDWNMELSGYYQSGITFGVMTIDPRYSIDYGVSKKVLDGRGTIKFNVTDIFWSQQSKVVIDQGDIDLVVDQRNDTRKASLTFNYSFGNQEVKQARRRSTATEAETKRL